MVLTLVFHRKEGDLMETLLHGQALAVGKPCGRLYYHSTTTQCGLVQWKVLALVFTKSGHLSRIVAFSDLSCFDPEPDLVFEAPYSCDRRRQC